MLIRRIFSVFGRGHSYIFLKLSAEKVQIFKSHHFGSFGNFTVTVFKQVASVVDFQLNNIFFWRYSVFFIEKPLQVTITYVANSG